MATIAGIDVRLHITLLLLLWLVLAAANQPGDAARTALYLTLLFGSVLVHELAHSIVARRVGVTVEEIELFPLGGASKMDRLPDHPAHELAIAGAGPLTSLALGGALLVAGAIVGAGLWPPDLGSGRMVHSLAWANVLLAAFNLLPALPLDGGRVLRALLERRIGPAEATRVAARWGRHIAVGMIAVGLFVNFWLVLIGLFVYISSNAEEAGAAVHQRLVGMTAGDLMVRHPLVVPADTTLARLHEMLSTTAQRQFPIVSDTGEYLGIVDVNSTATLDGDTVVADIFDLVNPVPVDHPAEDELGLLGRHGGTALAVVDGRAVVGIVRAEDLARIAKSATTKARTS